MKTFNTMTKAIAVCAGACCLFAASHVRAGNVEVELPNMTRTWTAKDASSTVEATAESLSEKEIKLRRMDNKRSVYVPLDKLGEDDLKWIEENRPFIGKSESELKKLVGNTSVGKELKGKTYGLSDEKWSKKAIKPTAKYFIVYHSASWCPPCRAQMPHSVEVYNEKISQIPGLELVWCSADNSDDAAIKWAKDMKMPWPILLPKAKKDIFKEASPSGYPNLFLVDGNGKVIEKAGIDALVNKAEELLKKGK